MLELLQIVLEVPFGMIGKLLIGIYRSQPPNHFDFTRSF